jgi:hypothetical protein
VVWHASPAWVLQASLTRSQMHTLELVNQWLHGSHDHLVVPSRERSLEVFADEKLSTGLWEQPFRGRTTQPRAVAVTHSGAQVVLRVRRGRSLWRIGWSGHDLCVRGGLHP